MLLSRRYRRTFLLVFVIAVVAVQAVAFAWPGTYEAHAAVLLQKTRLTGGVDADPKQPTTVVSGTVSDEEVNSEVAVLTSRQVLEPTMKATGLDTIPPPWYIRAVFAPLRAYERAYAWAHGTPNPTQAQRALSGLINSVAVDRMKESNILVVSYGAGDPRFAEVVLNELLKHYLDRHVAVHSQMDVQPFFTTQATVLQKEVTDLQEQLQTLKALVGVADFNVEREIVMRQDASLREEELLLQRQLRQLDGKIAAVQRTIGSGPGWTRTLTTRKPASQAMDTFRSQLLQLELDQIRLESRFTDASPLVIENRAKLDAAHRAMEQERAIVDEESTTGEHPTLLALQQDVARTTADRAGTAERLGAVQGQLRQSRERIALIEAKASEPDRLDLQLRSAKDRYLMYLDRTEKARVDAALDRSQVANVSIVQHANASLKPIRPQRLITLIVSIVGGLAIALFVCIWLELMSMGLVRTLQAAVPRLTRLDEGRRWFSEVDRT